MCRKLFSWPTAAFLAFLAGVPTTPAALAAEAASPGPPPDAYDRSARQYRSFFDFGGFGQGFETVLPEGRTQRWRASVSVDGTYTDNFDLDRRSRDAFYSSGVLGLGVNRRSSTFTGDLDYRYSTPIYRSENAEDRSLTTQAGAASLRWRPAERWTVSGGGSVTRNNEDTLETAPSGVSRSHRNRSDQYGAQSEVEWRAGAGTSARASYSYLYRNYRSEEADAGDSLNHHAAASLSSRLGRSDLLSLSSSYDFQRGVLAGSDPGGDDRLRRETGAANAAWEHTLTGAVGGSGTTLRAAYGVEKGSVTGDEDYWSHSPSVGVTRSFTPRTQGTLNGGYTWVLKEEGGTDSSWIGNLTLDHRFSEYTTVTLTGSRAWEQRPVSTRGDVTQLARTWRASLTVRSQLARYARASLEGHYESGDLIGETEEHYRDAGGSANLDYQLGQKAFLGVNLSATWRDSDLDELVGVNDSDAGDSYFLRSAALYYRRELVKHLSMSVRYSFTERSPVGSSELESYSENRIYGVVTAEL